MNLLHNKLKKCTLHDVFLVPGLAYNLLSVTSASKRGKEIKFSEMTCEICDSKSKVVAIGRREGSLYMYYLDHVGPTHQVYTGSDQKESMSLIWHRRFGHLGMQGLQELVKGKMATGLDISSKSEFTFCESCVQSKSHRLPFQHSHL